MLPVCATVFKTPKRAKKVVASQIAPTTIFFSTADSTSGPILSAAGARQLFPPIKNNPAQPSKSVSPTARSGATDNPPIDLTGDLSTETV